MSNTTHLAAIREAAKRILYAVPGLEGILVDVVGRDAERILRLLDEAEKGGTTTVTRDVCCDHGEITNYGAYRCDKCGTKTLDTYPHCPGCGRRIVKEDDK